MADTVYNVENIKLQDDTEVELRPAVISVLRKGNAALNEYVFKEGASEDDVLTGVIKACTICLAKQIDGFTEEIAEDVLDMETCYKILEVCLGVKLNNPKLLEAAMLMEASKKENG